MRIDVIGKDESTTPQARAYAEYRVFATLARHARLIRNVRVELAHAERPGPAVCVTCAVHVTLEPSGSAHARTQALHAFAAIDRAAERISDLMARRVDQTISS